MTSLKVSAWVDATWSIDDILTVASEAEQTGFHGIWVADHFMSNTSTAERADTGMHECFSVLAGLATAVPRVRLGSMVAGMTYRHPAVLANMAATIDRLSGGRLVLGLGAGWQINEHQAYGIELGTVRERIDRFHEGVRIIRGLTTQRRTTLEGAYYTVVDAPMDPKPVQARLPLLIGATGEQRMLGIVAETADEWNCWSTPEVFAAKSAVLNEHCERIGRDPATIWRTTQAVLDFDPAAGGTSRFVSVSGSVDQIVDVVGQWQSTGLNEWIIPGHGPVERARETFERVTTEILPQLS